jgi:hypothetical protein
VTKPSVRPLQPRIVGLVEELPDPPVVVLDGDRLKGLGDGDHQELQVAVVTLVMLHNCATEPAHVALVRGLVRLLRP